MDTKKYAPYVLILVAAALAVIYLIRFIRNDFHDFADLVACILFGAAAIMSFMKNSDLQIGYYVYIIAFAYWTVLQVIYLAKAPFNIDSLISAIPYVLIGLFILFYLLDDDVKNTFSMRFSLRK